MTTMGTTMGMTMGTTMEIEGHGYKEEGMNKDRDSWSHVFIY